MSSLFPRIVTATLLLPISSLAVAHGSPAAAEGFVAGFIHPLSGLDHLLSLTLAGIVIGRLACRPWLLAGGFAGAFLLGLLAGTALGPQAGIDALLLLSLPLMGFLLWRGAAPTAGLLWPALTAIAALHGFAHGMDGHPSPAWMAGAAVGMNLLLTVGMAIGWRLAVGERSRV